MDDGDLDFSNPDTYLCPALGTDPPSSCSMDSYFDEILKDTEHHACMPPCPVSLSPSLSHPLSPLSTSLISLS